MFRLFDYRRCEEVLGRSNVIEDLFTEQTHRSRRKRNTVQHPKKPTKKEPEVQRAASSIEDQFLKRTASRKMSRGKEALLPTSERIHPSASLPQKQLRWFDNKFVNDKKTAVSVR
jgi:hypothetical protein